MLYTLNTNIGDFILLFFPRNPFIQIWQMLTILGDDESSICEEILAKIQSTNPLSNPTFLSVAPFCVRGLWQKSTV